MEELVRLAENARVRVRRDGEPKADGKCVVYWMQAGRSAESTTMR